MRAVTRYRGQNLSFAHPDHLCFDRTTYDNINGPGGPFMLDIVGPAGPLMYPDQISRDRLQDTLLSTFMVISFHCWREQFIATDYIIPKWKVDET